MKYCQEWNSPLLSPYLKCHEMSDPSLGLRLALWSVETDRPLQKALYTILKQLRGTFKVPMCPLAITGGQSTDLN